MNGYTVFFSVSAVCLLECSVEVIISIIKSISEAYFTCKKLISCYSIASIKNIALIINDIIIYNNTACVCCIRT